MTDPLTAYVDQELSDAMRFVRRACHLGLAARQKAGIRVRQPLADVFVRCQTVQEARWVERFSDILCDEVNVKAVRVMMW